MDSINKQTLTHSKINRDKIIYISRTTKMKNTHKKVQWLWKMNNKIKIDLKMILSHDQNDIISETYLLSPIIIFSLKFKFLLYHPVVYFFVELF